METKSNSIVLMMETEKTQKNEREINKEPLNWLCKRLISNTIGSERTTGGSFPYCFSHLTISLSLTFSIGRSTHQLIVIYMHNVWILVWFIGSAHKVRSRVQKTNNKQNLSGVTYIVNNNFITIFCINHPILEEEVLIIKKNSVEDNKI